MNVDGNFGNEPNYYASNKQYQIPNQDRPIQQHQEVWNGPAQPFHWATSPGDIDFVQARDLYKVLGKQKDQQEHLAYNIGTHVAGANPEIQQRVIDMFSRVDEGLGANIRKEIEKNASAPTAKI